MALPDHKITISPANNNDIPKQAGDVAGKGANGSWVSLAVNEIIDAVIERVKALLGTANFTDAPLTTLQGAYNHANAVNNPHGVTPGQVGNATAQWNADKIQGSTVDAVAPTNQQVLTWSSSSSKVVWAAPPGLGGGEANTATNTGVGGVGVFKGKNGINLEFRNINSGSNKITVTNDSVNNEIDIDISETNLVVTANLNSHASNSSNPHGVTATQIGKDTAQWNASQLHGRNISSVVPSANQVYAWNASASLWEPQTISAGGTGGGSGVAVWQVKNAAYTAASGNRLILDASATTWTLTLPLGVVGSEVDFFGNSANTVTIALNGAKFEGQNVAELSYKTTLLEKLVYVDSIRGWQSLFDRVIARIAFNQAILANTPAMYWRLNEISGTVANDISGNAKHATYVGGYTQNQISAVLDKSVKLNGTSGYIDAPLAGAPSGATPRTIMCVVYLLSSSNQALVSIGSGGGQHFILYAGSTLFTDGVNSANNLASPNGGVVPLNVWSLLHFVFESGTYKYYLNGLLKGSGNLTIDTSGSGVRIGDRSDAFREYSSAYFDEVAIFGSALTQSQITKHYAAFADPVL